MQGENFITSIGPPKPTEDRGCRAGLFLLSDPWCCVHDCAACVLEGLVFACWKDQSKGSTTYENNAQSYHTNENQFRYLPS